MIEDPIGRIDYGEEGSGRTILFVPGSWATPSAWRDVSAPLKDRYRIVTTSLLGYGRTEERRTAADASIRHETDVLGKVLDRAGSGAHVVGHSFGAVVGLAMALRNPSAIASLTLIEPPLFGVLRRASEHALFAEMKDMTEAYFHEFAGGDPRAARRVIDFYGGAGAFEGLAPKFRDYVVATTPANILDWISAREFDEPLEVFAGLETPTLVVRGELGHPTVQRLTAILAQTMPRAALVTVKDASHFMIATHASEVAHCIERHVSGVEAAR